MFGVLNEIEKSVDKSIQKLHIAFRIRILKQQNGRKNMKIQNTTIQLHSETESFSFDVYACFYKGWKKTETISVLGKRLRSQTYEVIEIDEISQRWNNTDFEPTKTFVQRVVLSQPSNESSMGLEFKYKYDKFTTIPLNQTMILNNKDYFTYETKQSSEDKINLSVVLRQSEKPFEKEVEITAAAFVRFQNKEDSEYNKNMFVMNENNESLLLFYLTNRNIYAVSTDSVFYKEFVCAGSTNIIAKHAFVGVERDNITFNRGGSKINEYDGEKYIMTNVGIPLFARIPNKEEVESYLQNRTFYKIGLDEKKWQTSQKIPRLPNFIVHSANYNHAHQKMDFDSLYVNVSCMIEKTEQYLQELKTIQSNCESVLSQNKENLMSPVVSCVLRYDTNESVYACGFFKAECVLKKENGEEIVLQAEYQYYNLFAVLVQGNKGCIRDKLLSIGFPVADDFVVEKVLTTES